jgi:hypothetical protein
MAIASALRNMTVMTGLLCSLLLAEMGPFASSDRSGKAGSIAGAPQDAATRLVLSQASFDAPRAYSNDLSRTTTRHLRYATFPSRQPDAGPKAIEAIRLTRHSQEGRQAHSLFAQCVSLLI